MDFSLNLLLIIGLIFFLGLISDIIGKKTSIPRVTFLILLGIILGPSGISFLPQEFITNWFEYITTIALGMVGFLLGQQFTLKAIRRIGKEVFYIATSKVLVTFFLLSFVLMLFGVDTTIALILASIATATAPAATYEVVHELKLKNKFTKILLAVVAFDDILALILFSIVLSFVSIALSGNTIDIIASGFFEIFGSILLGYLLGFPVAMITGRLNGGEPIMVEALGSIFLICGLSIMLGLSPILSAIVMGSTVATYATHHKIAFHAIKNIEWPFMIIFFLLAGASLKVNTLYDIGLIGIIYIIVRVIAIYLGAKIGSKLANSQEYTQNMIGFALMPQAGVAIGMALMASQKLQTTSEIILPIILGTTVFFELFGPLAVRYVIKRSKTLK